MSFRLGWNSWNSSEKFKQFATLTLNATGSFVGVVLDLAVPHFLTHADPDGERIT
jgi:hypothetical protein